MSNPFISEQPDENYRPKSVYNTNESHMAICFVLDTSASMNNLMDKGTRIDALNAAMNLIKEQCCSEDDSRSILDTAIIRFDKDYEIVQTFSSVVDMLDVNLPANGGATYYVPPIRKALEMVRDQTHFYCSLGEIHKKPWVVFITDGEPHDDENDLRELAQYIGKKMKEGKVSFRSLMVGGENAGALHALSPIVLRANDSDAIRKDFSNFIAKSVANISQSAAGQTPKEANLTGGLGIDQDMSKFGGL